MVGSRKCVRNAFKGKPIIKWLIEENNRNIANLFQTYQPILSSMHLLQYCLSFDSFATQFFYEIYMIIIDILVPVTQYLVQAQNKYVKQITTVLDFLDEKY